MKLEFEYGHGLMAANLPDNTDVFIPGVTVPDPECLPQDWDSLYAATLESIRNPYGMPALKELAAPGKTVVFVIPDIVKGGCQPTAHRKVSIRACLDELYAGGVRKEDILFMFSNGLHPRATASEMKQILGEELFNEFYWSNQITSHDSEDYEHMVDLGIPCSSFQVLTPVTPNIFLITLSPKRVKSKAVFTSSAINFGTDFRPIPQTSSTGKLRSTFSTSSGRCI